jgi:hypothetical protein
VSNKENVPDQTIIDEREMYKYVKRNPTYGRDDRSGVRFIVGLVAVMTIALTLLGAFNYMSLLTADKDESILSLSRDLGTFPHGNAWVVAVIAITIVIYFLIRLFTWLLISFAEIMVAIDDKDTFSVIWHAVMFLIKVGILTGLIIAIVYFR